jgi:hypothetical protein
VSEWKEIIIKNFVALDGRYNKVLLNIVYNTEGEKTTAQEN